MAKKKDKKFQLVDVGWPGLRKRSKAPLRTELLRKSYKFDLPIQPQRNINRPIGVLNPWDVWHSEEVF